MPRLTIVPHSNSGLDVDAGGCARVLADAVHGRTPGPRSMLGWRGQSCVLPMRPDHHAPL